jgi:hypothetical protein
LAAGLPPEAGRPGMLMHDLRRTAIRQFERSGISRSSAMTMSGHKTESIYRRYAISDETSLREAAAQLDRYTRDSGTGTKSGTNRIRESKKPNVAGGFAGGSDGFQFQRRR